MIRKYTNQPDMHYLRRLTAFSLATLITFSIFGLNGYSRRVQQPGGKEGRQELKTGKSEPKQTRGAPYPAAKPSKRIPNPDPKPQPVPTGPKVGSIKPSNSEIKLKQITSRDGKASAPTTTLHHLLEPAS